jgi:HSP20 family protein
LRLAPCLAVDIKEDEKSFKVTAEPPGLTDKDIELSLSGNTLVIKGKKEDQKEQKENGYYLSEHSYGGFQRSFILPEGIDPEKIEAEVSKGLLAVTVPKTVQAVAKKIEIKTSA